MRRLFISFVGLFVVFGSWASPSFGYDIDTHFYATYAMARYAGIAPEVALKLATGAQWIDEGWTTTPMDTFLLYGNRKRRMNHFLADLEMTTGSSHGPRVSLLGLISEAMPNHPIASIEMMNGLKAGNMYRVGSALHRLEDTYGHAGFTQLLGHAYAGHHPDRPWMEPEKYEKMVKLLFKAMVAIRKALPPEALDKEFRDSADPGSKANFEWHAEKLAESYLARPDVQRMYKHDYLSDPRYVRVAAAEVLNRLVKAKIVKNKAAVEKLIIEEDVVNPNLDTRGLLRNVIRDILHPESRGFKTDDLVDRAKFVKTYLRGYGLGIVPFAERDSEQQENILIDAVRKITRNLVPEQLSDTHKFEREEDGPVRTNEENLRIGDWQDTIDGMFGDGRIRFVSTPSLFQRAKAWWSGKPIHIDPNPEKGPSLNVTYDFWDRLNYRFNENLFLFSPKRWFAHAPEDSTLWQVPKYYDAQLEKGNIKPLVNDSKHQKLVQAHGLALANAGMLPQLERLEARCNMGLSRVLSSKANPTSVSLTKSK